MTTTYSKPHLSFQDQLNQLKTRGLQVGSDEYALDWLRRLGYYRLSAHWHPFRNGKAVEITPGKIGWQLDDTFKEGAAFEHAVAFYHFDKKLRLLVMDAIEQIEVAARVDIAHYLGVHDVFAQENASLFDGKFTRPGPNGEPSRHAEWLQKLAHATDRSKEEFVTHYKDQYDPPLPVWVSIELWDFGLLSKLYAGMKYADKTNLALRFGVGRPDLMTSWLRTLNYVRNIAAHHGRLWNRNIVDRPMLPRLGEIAVFDGAMKQLQTERVYTTLCILAFLIEKACPGTDWAKRTAEHLESFPAVSKPSIDETRVGCLTGWKQHGFWPA